MIIANGTIEVKLKEGGGIDPTTGFPVTAGSDWGFPIPCQVVPISENRIGVVNGEHYRLATYTIFVEGELLYAGQIRLHDRVGREVGVFSIKRADYLEAVCETRLTV